MNIRKQSRVELNRHAWENPANWSRRSMFGVYFSKQDDRLWVPKALPALGWTINFAHPAGAPLIFGLLALSALAAGLGAILAVH